jgi:hypothetical protein
MQYEDCRKYISTLERMNNEKSHDLAIAAGIIGDLEISLAAANGRIHALTTENNDYQRELCNYKTVIDEDENLLKTIYKMLGQN